MTLSELVNDRISKGIDRIIEAQGNQTFELNGNNYLCAPGTLNDGETSIDAGFDESMAVVLTVPLAQFEGDTPQLLDFITFQNSRVQIKKIKRPYHGVFWVLGCERPTASR